MLHALERYEALPLLALRALPSVQLSQALHPFPPGAAAERERTNHAIRARVGEAIRRIAPETDKDALAELFAFRTPDLGIGARHENASNHLGVTVDTVRKEREPKLLDTLTDEIIRGEFAWSLSQLDPDNKSLASLAINGWCDLVEFERTVVIDEQDPRVQHWASRFTLRCTKPDQPFFVAPMYWTGTSTDGKGLDDLESVEVLSGPRPGDEGFPHRLLGTRRESASSDAFVLYVWDLGEPVLADTSIELHWQQELVDTQGTFRPFIGIGMMNYPQVEKIRLRAKELTASGATCRQVLPTQHPPAGSYSEVGQVVNKEEIERDTEGYFTYESESIQPGVKYELWWQ